MASWLIAAVGFIYLWTAGALWVEGKQGLSIAFIGYALGNVGLYMEAKGLTFADLYAIMRL